jgi:protein-disulfide isomerase
MKSLAISLSALEQDLKAATMTIEQEPECPECEIQFNEYKRIKKVIQKIMAKNSIRYPEV